MRRSLALAVGAALSLAVPAFAFADCPQYHCTADHAGTAATSLDAANVPTLKPAWAFRTGGRIYGAPAVADGLVYAGSDDGNVYAVDAATGAQRWAFRTGGAIWSTPALSGKLVIFGSADDSVYAPDAATGRQRWEVTTRGHAAGPPPPPAGPRDP